VTTGAEHNRIRDLAQAEVAENAPPMTSGQAALVTSLLARPAAEAAAKRQAQQDSGQAGAA
jgi:hypothetical protein